MGVAIFLGVILVIAFLVYKAITKVDTPSSNSNPGGGSQPPVDNNKQVK